MYSNKPKPIKTADEALQYLKEDARLMGGASYDDLAGLVPRDGGASSHPYVEAVGVLEKEIQGGPAAYVEYLEHAKKSAENREYKKAFEHIEFVILSNLPRDAKLRRIRDVVKDVRASVEDDGWQ